MCCGLLEQHIDLSPPWEQVVLPTASQIRCISPFPTQQEKTAIKIRFKNKSACGHSLTMPQPVPCAPSPPGQSYLHCSHPSQQEKLPVRTQSCVSPPEPRNTGKHPKNPRETGLLACFRQARQGGSKHSRMPSKPARVCFALEEWDCQRICFGSFNLFTHTHTQKHPTKNNLPGRLAGGPGPGGKDVLVLFKVSSTAQLPGCCAQAWPRVQGGTIKPLGP